MLRSRFRLETSVFLLLVIASFFILPGVPASAQAKKKTASVNPITTNVSGIKKWIAAFDQVNQRILHQPNRALPMMIFFDDSLAYVPITSPADTLHKSIQWNMQPHGGSLRLPDGRQYRISLMSFAAEDVAHRPFFVMAAPSYWASKKVRSPELGIDNLLTAVFIHEYTHIFQFDGFGAQINAIAGDSLFRGVGLSDDVVQEVFSKDTSYVKLMQSEIAEFYKGLTARTDSLAIVHAKQGLRSMKERQAKYHTDSLSILSTAERLFLSMEGMGQWTALQWLKHPKGAKLNYNQAVDGIRRRRNKWTQEEGLALFMLLERFGGHDWIPSMFSRNPEDILVQLKSAIDRREAKSAGAVGFKW